MAASAASRSKPRLISHQSSSWKYLPPIVLPECPGADPSHLKPMTADLVDTLVERTSELSVLEGLVAATRDGSGGVVAVTGIAGIGKTTLLDAGVEMARASGFRVLVARADELGSSYSWAVVRDLFQANFDTGGASEIALKKGPAGYALRALHTEGDELAPGDAFAVTNGLYWLAVELCQREPVLIAVDDLQWCDPASARWLIYLAERLEGLRIGLLLAWRTGEPVADEGVMARFEVAASRASVAPHALSAEGVEAILERHLGRCPPAEVVNACHDLTAGNPFLVTEIAAALRADHTTDDATTLAQVRELAPRSVMRSVSLRIARLGRAAAELASAVAVLGDRVPLVHAAALAGISLEDAAHAADALASMGIFEAGTPLQFTHSLVRAALYEDIPPVARRLRHAIAARVLAEQLASDELICAHVLRCDPGAYQDAVDHLSNAATQALSRGAPEVAVTYLARALEEPVGRPERCQLLHRLGKAEALMRKPSASEHLEAALELASDDGVRADIATDLADVLGFHGRWFDALRAAEATLARVDATDYSRALSEGGPSFERLAYAWAALAGFDPTRIDRFDRFVAAERDAGPSQSHQREATRAVALGWRGDGRDEVPGLLDTVLSNLGPRGLSDAEPSLLMRVCAASLLSDNLSRLEALIDDLFEASRTQGSVFPMALALTYRTAVRARKGDLVGAAGDLRATFEVSLQYELRFGIPPALWYGADALIEREELSDLASLVEVIDVGPDFDRLVVGAIFREVRGRLALAEMKFDEARRHLGEAAAVFEKMRTHNPNGSSWRSALALALAADDQKEALRLVHSELADARRLGWSRPVGVALRALGLVEGGDAGLGHLGEAVDVLAGSYARLEQARAEVSLGSALRRANQRGAARTHLTAGLDLAQRCGAERLAAEARSELVAVGARPRRAAISGRESLTAAERRVAELAATGMTNREIAQALFVTINTVEGHLKQVFQKLSISSRKAIAASLESTAPAP
jgi:DNA-binding CsgD family transcriptional regulator